MVLAPLLPVGAALVAAHLHVMHITIFSFIVKVIFHNFKLFLSPA